MGEDSRTTTAIGTEPLETRFDRLSHEIDPGDSLWKPELAEHLYSLLYGEDLGADELDNELGRLKLDFGEIVYSELLHILAHLRFEPAEAEQHWRKILGHRLEMQRKLDSAVDLRVALTSYFVQVNRKLHNPKIIELKLFEQTQASAYRDELTGLHNYRLFREYLGQEIQRSQQHGTALSLVMVDVDNFKTYNDRNGHEAGNEVLRQIAHQLTQSLRRGDLAARYGGEEFVLILPMTSKTTAFGVAEDARVAIEEHRFPSDARQPGGSLTVSMGIATYPADAQGFNQLVRHADRAMYVAKSSGKNLVQLYGQSRRSFQRVTAALSGEYRVLVAESHPLTTVDVSERGLRFFTERPLPVGALIDFRVDLPAAGTSVAACGRVVHVAEQQDGRYQAALRVTDIEPSGRDALLEYLRSFGLEQD